MPPAPSATTAAAAAAAAYELQVASGNSPVSTLMLRAGETSVDELRKLLTAKFSRYSGDASSQAVALQDVKSGKIYPLDVVSARPDLLSASSGSRLSVLFSLTRSTALLRQLFLRKQLSLGEVNQLYTMTEDPFFLAAMEVYEEERDEMDLVDTLRRIVAIRVVSPAKKAAGPAPTQQAMSPRDALDTSIQELTRALELTEFPRQEVLDLIARLVTSRHDAAVLEQLANKELPQLQAAYEVYAMDKSDQALSTAFSRLAKQYGLEHVVQGKSYAAKVIKAFCDGDVKVCGAWDVYVDDLNAEDFADTLLRIAKRWENKHELNTSAGGSGAEEAHWEEPSEEKQALRKMVLWLHSEMKVSGEEGHELMRKIDRGSPVAEEAMRAFALKKTPEAQQVLVDTVLGLLEEDSTSSQNLEEEDEDYEPLRQSLSEFLSSQVGKKGGLSQAQNRILQSLVNKRDARLLAAFDLFQEDLDEEDLLDSLHHLCNYEDDTEGEEEEECVDYNLEELYDRISATTRGSLTMENLEVIREALETQNPKLEEIISDFVETEDEDAFRQQLVLFCNTSQFDLDSLLAAVKALGLSDRDFKIVEEAMREQNGDVDMALYDYVQTGNAHELKQNLVKFCRLTVDQAYDTASLLSIISELGLAKPVFEQVKQGLAREDERDAGLDVVVYDFVESEDLAALKLGLEAYVAAAAAAAAGAAGAATAAASSSVEEKEGQAPLSMDAILGGVISKLGLTLDQFDLVQDALEARHPDCEELIARFLVDGNKEALKQGLEAWTQTQI